MPHPKINTKRRRHPDRRRAAHHQPADRVPHLLFISDVEVDSFNRQLCLVEQAYCLARP